MSTSSLYGRVAGRWYRSEGTNGYDYIAQFATPDGVYCTGLATIHQRPVWASNGLITGWTYGATVAVDAFHDLGSFPALAVAKRQTMKRLRELSGAWIARLAAEPR